MNSILGLGLQGIRSGFEQVAKASERLSRAFEADSNIDPTTEAVAQSQGALQVKASAKIVQVADELNDATLDIIA